MAKINSLTKPSVNEAMEQTEIYIVGGSVC